MEIAVIGAGTYGSYVIDSILTKYPNANITLFDVGDSTVKSESEIGYFSSVKKEIYKGIKEGRWFGFGGASAKWGGQLLTFTDNDFENPNSFMNDIIRLNMRYKVSMLKKFNIENNHSENAISKGLFTKTGVWLSVFGRNFFKHFQISNRKQVEIHSHCRISHLKTDHNNKIEKIFYIQDNQTKEAEFDFYFLTAGAFEIARILMSSDIASSKTYFSDHLSQKVFRIKNSTYIGDEDFVFKMKGFSLITKRLIGEINDVSFYAHPVFNMDFPFFQSIKTLLFKREFSWKAIKDAFVNIPQVIAFAWTVLIKRKIFVLNNEWFIYIDIENPTKDSYVTLSEQKDDYGIQGLDVYYEIGEEAELIYAKSKLLIENLLIEKGVEFEVISEKIEVSNSEDINHPFRMYSDFNSVEEYYNQFENMLVVSTGILPRSGGINPTASVLPLIDDFVQIHFKNIQLS